MTTVVLVAPSGRTAEILRRLGLPREDVSAAVVSWSSPDFADTGVESAAVGVPSSGAETRIVRSLSGSPIGRNLLRLLPWDGGRRLRRAVKSDPRARALLAAADIIVVTERDGILTGWHAGRHWAAPATEVVYGAAAADTLIQLARGV